MIGYFIVALLLSPVLASAQDASEDVCCVLGSKTEGGGASTRATVMTKSDCQAGKAVDEFQVCKSFPDPENTCSDTSAQDQCSMCGFHWNGEDCLAEDPVKKAKEDLKEEEEKEKAAAEKAGKKAGSETPTPESE